MCPYDTIAPTFPPLSQKFSDGRTDGLGHNKWRHKKVIKGILTCMIIQYHIIMKLLRA